MKVKQHTLKGFECEIDDIESFKTYYTKNAPLMQGHLLILQGKVNAEIKAFLDEKDAVYVDGNEKTLLTRKKRSTAVLELPTVVEEFAHEKQVKQSASKVFHRPIRSGESIVSDANLLFMGRINSGALIESSGSVQVFGIIDGLVRSDGSYVILKKIGKGSVVFHGEELDKSQFDGRLQLVEYNNGAIKVKEIE